MSLSPAQIRAQLAPAAEPEVSRAAEQEVLESLEAVNSEAGSKQDLSGGVESRHAGQRGLKLDAPASTDEPEASVSVISESSASPAQNSSQASAREPAPRYAGPPERTESARGKPPLRVLTVSESPQAERAALAAIAQFPKVCLPIFTERGRSDFFYNPAHEQLFHLLNDFYTEHGHIDGVAFMQHALDSNQAAKIGGPGAIAALWAANVGGHESFTYHLDILRDKYVARQTKALAQTLSAKIENASEDALWEAIAEHEKGLADLRALAKERQYGRLPMLCDMSVMLNGNKPPRPAELVTGLLHKGSKLIVGGTSKGRKTFSLLDLALSVATGSQWWGFDTLQGAVCYINFEIQESFFCERITDILRAKKLELSPDMFMGWNLRGHSEGIENLIEEIVAKIIARDFALVVFDPIYKGLGDRDENKAGDIASLMNQLERVAVKTGAAIAFGAHYSKGNQALKESIDRIGGSGVFARDPDSILTMTAHEEPDAFTVDCTLRNFKPIEPFVLRWDWPLFIRTDLDPEALKQPRKNNSGQFTARYSKESLLEELSVLQGVRPGALYKRLSEMEGISRAQFYRLAKQLKDDGKLREFEGVWYRANIKSEKT